MNRLVVASAADCPMESYSIYVSNLDAPGVPTVSPADWELVERIETTFPLTERLFASRDILHVALWFHSFECGNLLGRHHQVGAIEAWTVPNLAPPPPQAPSCSNGG